MKTADVCRKHGISSATLYAWKAKYGGMDVSQARKLKVLEDENARLKRLLDENLLISLHDHRLLPGSGLDLTVEVGSDPVRRAAAGDGVVY